VSRARRLPVVVAAILALALAALPAAAGAQQGKALVRLAHFAENVEVGDIYVVFVNGRQKFDDVPYKTISDYLPLDPGTYKIEVRPARAPSTAPAEAKLDVTVEAGRAYTVAVWGEGGTVSAIVLNDDVSRPPSNGVRLRAINAISDSQPVDIVSGGKVILPGVRPASASGYVAVAAGQLDLEVRRPSDGQVLARAPQVTLGSGTVASVAAIGGSGKGSALLVARDAVGSQAPAGGVATGAGGTAHGSGPSPWLLALAATVVATVAVICRRRTA
jgi:hypothetical protein